MEMTPDTPASHAALLPAMERRVAGGFANRHDSPKFCRAWLLHDLRSLRAHRHAAAIGGMVTSSKGHLRTIDGLHF